MKENRDFDFIKSKFDEENITAPQDLNESTVRNMIEGKRQNRIGFYQTKRFKTLLSTAACIAAVVTVFAAANSQIFNDIIGDALPQAQVLNSFNDIGELKSMVADIEENPYYNEGEMGGNAAGEMLIKNPVEGATSYDKSDYAATNKQVDAVDEADILKNDGRYIYVVGHENNSCVKIYKPNGSEPELVSIVDETSFTGYTEEALQSDGTYVSNETIVDLYVYNDILVINTIKTLQNAEHYDYYSIAHIYDISDIKSPKEINSFSQSGELLTSRLIDNRLYIVSKVWLSGRECKTNADYIPYTGNAVDNRKEQVSLNSIYHGSNPGFPIYLMICAIDIETGEKIAEPKAVFGASCDIYCNENNMYIAMTALYAKDAATDKPIDTQLEIVKLSLGKKSIRIAAKGCIAGLTSNQFSMDEKDGNLRIATTSYDINGRETNNLFVLDKKLKQIGEITGFAENESIRAVRFIDDTAYVVTYKQTDPLFVIDLKNPKEPQIKGEVKISGFSNMLVPADNHMLLGIGQSDDENSGLKLVLFDISDKEHPRVADSYVISDAYSEAQYNHLALAANYSEGYFAIPLGIIDDVAKTGAITIQVKNGKIEISNQFMIESQQQITRCTYVDNVLYATDYYGDIFHLELK